MIKTLKLKNRNFSIIIAIILLFHLFIIGLTIPYANIKTINCFIDEYNEKNPDNPLKEPLIADSPNITRIGYPIVLSNETATNLWTQLNNRSVDNIRIAYYSIDDEWVLIPFQLDEKAYFRSFVYQQGSQAIYPPLQVDISNWGQYITEHRYVGKDIDANSSVIYKEPTKYECELGFWSTRLAEGWDPRDPTLDPGVPDPAPTQDPREIDGGILDQLEHRVDYDDELVFYAQNGQKVDISNWNLINYPHRYEIELYDPVDSGKSWIYLYYDDNMTGSVPNNNYFIPSGGQDLISWDSNNLKVTGVNYDYTVDLNNNDLGSNVSVKLQGYSTNMLYTESGKQWVAVNLHIKQLALGTLVVFDVNGSADIWREGEWGNPRVLYNEQTTTIGYDVTMDLDLMNLAQGLIPGQDINYTNSHRALGVGGQPHTGILDAYHDIFGGLMVIAYDDDGDHDGNITEPTPFLRGVVNQTHPTNEAAIDGPCRVILDKFTVQMFGIDLGIGNGLLGAVTIGYEEFWTASSETLKFYANMISNDPTAISTDYSNPDNPEQLVEARLHFAYMEGQNFTDNIRNDPESYILLGQAPNGDLGLPDLLQCREEGKTWPLYLYPDRDGDNDDLVSDTGPIEEHFDNTSLNTNSTGTGIGDGNPMSDWKYIHSSTGGAWIYMPYNETWKLFTEEEHRDVATYWNDNSEFTETSIYVNHANKNGATDPFPERTVFGNFSEWECKREYARLKLPLENYVIFKAQHLDNIKPIWDPMPEDVSVQLGAPLSYDVDANDENGISYYWINDTINLYIYPNNGTIINATILLIGTYEVEIRAFDISDNYCSANITITVIASANPIWLIDPIDQLSELGIPFNYDVSASDSDGIDQYLINDTSNFYMGPTNGTITNASFLIIRIYDLNITVYDTLAYFTSTIITITIVDTTGPYWNEIPIDQTTGYADQFYYNVNASDLSGIDYYEINDTIRFDINPITGELTNKTIPSLGNYLLNISVYDNYNNILNRIIKINVIDNINPVWDVIPSNQTVEYLVAFKYDVNASDLFGIQYYWINLAAYFYIDSNNGTIINNIPLQIGNYTVEVRAYDNSNNYCSVIITISVVKKAKAQPLEPDYDDDVEKFLSEKIPISNIYYSFAISLIVLVPGVIISKKLYKIHTNKIR